MQEPVNSRRAFLVALVILGVAFLFILKPLFIPISLAGIITILLYPVYATLLRLLNGHRYLASFVATFLIFLVLVLPFGIIFALIVDQTIDLVGRLHFNQETLDYLFSGEFYAAYVQPFLTYLEEELKLSINLPQILSKTGSQVAQTIYRFSPQVVGQTASFMFGFFVMHLSIYFFFIEGQAVVRTILDLSPLESRYEQSLIHQMKNMLDATVYGYLVTALVQGILAGFGFWVAGVPGHLVFGTLTYFMSMVPIIGATSVWLPVSIWLLITGNAYQGVGLFIYGALVVSGVDNILKPWLMKGKAKIHILLIFFSIFGGLSLFGPVGILFGPVITALFLASVRLYRQDFVKS